MRAPMRTGYNKIENQRVHAKSRPTALQVPSSTPLRARREHGSRVSIGVMRLIQRLIQGTDSAALRCLPASKVASFERMGQCVRWIYSPSPSQPKNESSKKTIQ